MAVETYYDIGDRPELVATFTNAAGTLEDPSAITFKIKDPSGNIATGDQDDATNESTGVWVWPAPEAIDEAGTWWFRAEATGTMQTAEEVAFQVRASQFPTA